MSPRCLPKLLSPLLAPVLLAWSACGRAPEAPPQATGEELHHGGTVVVGIMADVQGINELTSYAVTTSDHILGNIFLHLLEEQPDFHEHPPTFAPRLARSYEWSEDHKILTFHLREGVVWSDGTPVTADDVRFTWQAQTHPAVVWETSYMKESIADVEVVDPHTVRFHFTHVYPAQLVHANEGLILPKHVWGKLPFERWRESSSWFLENLVTNGPFRVGSWNADGEIVLVRNETYYEKPLPYLDRVVVRVIPEQASQMTQLLAGDLDFISNVSPDDAERVREAAGVKLDTFWGIGAIFIAWNNESPLFSDVRVRQALTLAINRQSIVEGLWGEYAQIADSPIVDSVWAHNKALEPWKHDPDRARRLLAEAGWEDLDGDGILEKGGRPFRFELLNHTGNRQREDAAILAQQDLRKVGIDAQPRLLDFGSFVAAVTDGQFDAGVAGLNIGTDVDLRYFLHSDQIGTGLNQARYRNPEIDQLIELASQQKELGDMAPYLNRIQEIVSRDQPVTFLWSSKRLFAYNQRIRGAKPNILSPYFNLRQWWVAPQP